MVDPSDEGFEIEHKRFECGVCNNTSRFKSNFRCHECHHLTEGNGPPGVDERISILNKAWPKTLCPYQTFEYIPFQMLCLSKPNVETNVLSMYAKFQLHHYYGF